MIQIENLHKSFKSFEALGGINLDVKRGEIYGFIGQNGAGKSTTMNILTGLSKPTTGRCLVNGKDVSTVRHPSELGIGYLPEDPQFYSWLTARETLAYLGKDGQRAHQVGSDQQPEGLNQRIEEMLHWVGLEEAADRRVGGFSRGMRQRLGICAAMIHDPQLLILDEPSSALDPEGRSEVLRLIIEMKSMGKTVFFSTHILSDVERVCDTIGIIAGGTMRMQKPLRDILQHNLLPIYDIIVQQTDTRELAEKLAQLDGVIKTECAGDQVSVTVSDLEATNQAILQLLAGHQAIVYSMAQRRHNLEDIFIQEVQDK